MWKFSGNSRPPIAVEPGPGQESVWDYPRPPALDPLAADIRVLAGARVLAEAKKAVRVLETASPPTVYLNPDDVVMSQLVNIDHSSYCEWKGQAAYLALEADPLKTPVAWYYPEPKPAFSPIKGWICFYPDQVACTMNDEPVRGQAGGFYGGWITDRIVGPFKGEPGTRGW